MSKIRLTITVESKDGKPFKGTDAHLNVDFGAAPSSIPAGFTNAPFSECTSALGVSRDDTNRLVCNFEDMATATFNKTLKLMKR